MEATLIKPTVGEGASIGNRVDCNPYTIIEVSSDLKTVTVFILFFFSLELELNT